MEYEGIKLVAPAGKVAMTHSRAMDLIKGQRSDQNIEWVDALAEIPWGMVKGSHPERFEHASKIFSLINMDYQVCNGGIGQYFYNNYHTARDPFSENDVANLDIDVQREFFSEIVNFAKAIYPERTAENTALEKACDAFYEVWFEENAVVIETVYCEEDEYIWDDELEEDVPNPDYFEPYDEPSYEDVIHGEDGFDDIFYDANDYLEELLELQAQLCCRKLVLEAEREPESKTSIKEELKSVLPESAFAKPSLSQRIQAASERQAGSSQDQSSMKLMPMPGTTSPDWGEKHWGSGR